MPIPRELFEKEVDAQDNKILRFLELHSSEAYKEVEIAKAINIDIEKVANMVALRVRLQRLENKGLIESRFTGGGQYYAAIR